MITALGAEKYNYNTTFRTADTQQKEKRATEKTKSDVRHGRLRLRVHEQLETEQAE